MSRAGGGFRRQIILVKGWNLAERVGFEPTWELSPPIRFRVGAVVTASVPLRDGRFDKGRRKMSAYVTVKR